MLKITNTVETAVVGLRLRLNAALIRKQCFFKVVAYFGIQSKSAAPIRGQRLFKGSAYLSNYGIVSLCYVFHYYLMTITCW